MEQRKKLKCACGKESTIDIIPISQKYICPECAKKTTYKKVKNDWGSGSVDLRKDGSIYCQFND